MMDIKQQCFSGDGSVLVQPIDQLRGPNGISIVTDALSRSEKNLREGHNQTLDQVAKLVEDAYAVRTMAWVAQTQTPLSHEEMHRIEVLWRETNKVAHKFILTNLRSSISEPAAYRALSQYVDNFTAREFAAPTKWHQKVMAIRSEYAELLGKALSDSIADGRTVRSAVQFLRDITLPYAQRHEMAAALARWSNVHAEHLLDLFKRSLDSSLEWKRTMDSSIDFDITLRADTAGLPLSDIASTVLKRSDVYRKIRAMNYRATEDFTSSFPYINTLLQRDELNSFPFHVALEYVHDSFEQVDPAAAAVVRSMKLSKSIGQLDSKNPSHFSFACYLQSSGPIAMVSYCGGVRDLLLLSHELGHAVHFDHLLKAQPTMLRSFSSLTAETVALFFSISTAQYLVKAEVLPRTNSAAIFESIIENLYRRSLGTLFGYRCAALVEHGRFNSESVQKCWAELNQDLFAQNWNNDPFFQYAWAFTPWNVLTPLFQQEYVLSPLLGLKLHAQFSKSPQQFRLDFSKFLSAGGTRTTAELFSDLGIDIRSATVVSEGIDALEELVGESGDTTV